MRYINFGFDILIHATAQLKKDTVRLTPTPYVPHETHFYIRYTNLHLDLSKSTLKTDIDLIPFN